MDDAWIGLRAVANLLAGRGLVFNPGERVEGVTNVGWLLLLAPLARLTSPPVAAKLAGLALLGLTLGLLYRAGALLARRLDPLSIPRAGLPVAVLLLAAANADLVTFSLLGMETAALAAVLSAMVVVTVRERGLAALPFLGAFAFLLHPEAVLVYPAITVLAVVDRRARARGAGRLLRGLLPYAALLSTITLIRFHYYGALLPNTWGAKPPTVRAALGNLLGALDGSAVNLAFPFAGLFALALLALGASALRRQAPLAAVGLSGVVGTGLLFALYARPDWTELGRYFAPYVPAALLLAGVGALEWERAVQGGAAGGRRGWLLRLWGLSLAGVALVGLLLGGFFAPDLQSLARWTAPALLALGWTVALEAERARAARPSQEPRGLAPLALALLVAFYGMTSTLARTTRPERLSYPGYILTSATLIPPALWIRDHLPPGAVIASRRIGALAYFSGHPVFDYAFGLTEPEVARRIRRHGGPFDDPRDPALADLWRRRAPDYLLEERDLTNRLGAAASGGRGVLHIHGLDYRVIRSFPIARGVEWVLAGRVEGSVLSSPGEPSARF
jgi:hypothetical protein